MGYQPPTVVPGGDLAKVMRAVCMIITRQRSQKFSRALTTSSILCIPSVHSYIGMSAKEWKRVNSARHAKIWLLLKRTTRRSALRLQRAKVKKKVMATSSEDPIEKDVCEIRASTLYKC